MMGKRLTALLLCLCIMCVGVVYAFNDTKGHWAEEYAKYLNEKGVLNGDDLGNANLGNNIKRSEFIAMLVRSLYAGDEIIAEKQVFSDVPKSKWYFGVISFAAEKNIVSGGGDGKFYPDNNISREEIVLMLYRALELSGGECTFIDVKSDYIYYKEIAAAVSKGIINGYSGNMFKPKANATRAEAAAMLCRVLAPETFIPNETVPEPEKPDTGTDTTRINLTWHQVYNKNVTSTGSYSMDGLDVISPMWFRIIDKGTELPQSYEYLLGEVPNYYLQDFGNSAYMEDAKKKGYEVWPLLKGDGTLNGQSKFLNNDKARTNAVEMMRSLSKTYGFSGINMDFENMRIEDKDKYTLFVKEMSEMCKQEGLTLSVDITKYYELGGTYSLCYDRREIAKYVDYVGLMAYDQNGTWSKKAGSVSSIPWTEECIKITLKEVPAEKILLGVPFYTRLWREENGTVVKTSAIGMDSAKKQISDAGAAIIYDEATGQNYAEWTDGSQICKIWLEDETSIKARLDLIEKYNLAGVASWSKSFENKSTWTYIKENLR